METSTPLPEITGFTLDPNPHRSMESGEFSYGLNQIQIKNVDWTISTPKNLDNKVFNSNSITFTVGIPPVPVGTPLRPDLFVYLKTFFPQIGAVYVNGCGADEKHRTSLGLPRSAAHTHFCPKMEDYKAICVLDENYVFLESKLPSDLIYHEYAHVLDQTFTVSDLDHWECLEKDIHKMSTKDKNAWERQSNFGHSEEFNRILREDLGRPDISGPYVPMQAFANAAAMIISK